MRYQYTCSLTELRSTPLEVLQTRLRGGAPAEQAQEQHAAWDDTVALLQQALVSTAHDGQLYFEFAIPRLGARIGMVANIGASRYT